LTWGPGAEEAWDKACEELRSLPDGRRRDIYGRAPELAVRLATVLAIFCGRLVLTLDDWSWAWSLVTHSCNMILKQANESMRVERDFDKICFHIKSLVADAPMSLGKIHFNSRTAAGAWGMEIVDKAIADLILSDELEELDENQQAALGLYGGGRRTQYFATFGYHAKQMKARSLAKLVKGE
jgi:hypothetical protein